MDKRKAAWLHFKRLCKVKFYTWLAARMLGAGGILALIHDLSRFLPDEFVAEVLYSVNKTNGLARMTEAQRRHHHRNKHHWQHWVVLDESRLYPVAVEMPARYVNEMVGGWIGELLADGRISLDEFFLERKDSIIMTPTSFLRTNLAVSKGRRVITKIAETFLREYRI